MRIILCYHRIGESLGKGDKISTPFRLILSHYRILKLFGFKQLSMEEVLTGASRGFLFTFDDGYEGPYEDLANCGVKGVIYRVVGRDFSSWNGPLDPIPLVGMERLKRLIDLGWIVGSHGLSHRSLTSIGPEEMEREIFEAKKILEELLGAEVYHFSYPFGHYSREVKAALRKAGYRTAVTTRKGWVKEVVDPFELPRLPIGRSMGPFKFIKKLLTSFLKS